MKKIIYVLISIILVSTLISCGGPKNPIAGFGEYTGSKLSLKEGTEAKIVYVKYITKLKPAKQSKYMFFNLVNGDYSSTCSAYSEDNEKNINILSMPKTINDVSNSIKSGSGLEFVASMPDEKDAPEYVYLYFIIEGELTSDYKLVFESGSIQKEYELVQSD